MKNYHKDLFAYYRAEVALPEAERTAMRERRDSNRRSLKAGLKRDDEPVAIGCESQGSYAMRTMTQHPDKDYDIDDGVYFEIGALVGPNGGNKTSVAAKEMVRKALHVDNKFKEPVTTLKNCVRVIYDAGYHVDVPVYRKVYEDENGNAIEPYFELASTNWKRSDPVSVTNWFNDHNIQYSMDEENGGQIRRIVRFIKKFSQSRTSWKQHTASGFMITKLVTDNYQGNKERDDLSFYNTVISIVDYLDNSLIICHPTLQDEYITNGDDDARPRFLREKLRWALKQLEIVLDPDCNNEDGLKAWSSVFATDFFSERGVKSQKQEAVSAAILKRGDEEAAKREAVNKRGNRRYGNRN